MATSPRKRQQKLEKRAAKRKEKKHLGAREDSAGIGQKLTAATMFPVLHAWVTDDLWGQGMGWVLLSRSLPGGSIAVSVFLIDRYCLGVKNAMVEIVHPTVYENTFVSKMHSQFTSRTVSPATARKFVESAVEYARELGFPPHPDYQKAKLLFGDIDPGEATEELEFGKDGKPFYINGPADNLSRIREILHTLERTCGPGNFEHMMIIGESGVPLDEDDELP